MRDVNTWQPYAQGSQPTLMFGRGYTGHEHLNDFGLINMNARLYDPLLARFLAPDPYVGSGMTNDFNRYIYCLNNPLMYTDPSGKSLWSWLKQNVFDAFKREWNSNFGSSGGFEIGYNSMGGGFINPTYNGAAFGPSVGISNSGQITTGNSQDGFHTMSPIGSSNRLDQSVVQAEQNARQEYFGEKSFENSYTETISAMPASLRTVSDAEMRDGNANGASEVNSISNIVGTVAGISQAAGYNATIGVWGDLSKIRYYSSGWSGCNQYVWKTFNIAEAASGIAYAANIYEEGSKFANGQPGLETSLNIGVSTTSLIVGGTAGIGISGGYEYLKFMWNNILNYGESVHQLFYEQYQNYWKGTEFDPGQK